MYVIDTENKELKEKIIQSVSTICNLTDKLKICEEKIDLLGKEIKNQHSSRYVCTII